MEFKVILPLHNILLCLHQGLWGVANTQTTQKPENSIACKILEASPVYPNLIKIFQSLHHSKWSLTIGSLQVRAVVSPCLVGEVLGDVHVAVDLLPQFIQHSAQVTLPVLSVQHIHELRQLDLCAVVPDLLIVMLSIFLAGGWKWRSLHLFMSMQESHNFTHWDNFLQESNLWMATWQ